MGFILKAMKSEYGSQWERMGEVEQIAAIASFLKYYSTITTKYKLL
jgi:hypothetical protein